MEAKPAALTTTIRPFTCGRVALQTRMRHGAFDVALGHFLALPAILATTENVPAHHDLAAHVVAIADVSVGIHAL